MILDKFYIYTVYTCQYLIMLYSNILQNFMIVFNVFNFVWEILHLGNTFDRPVSLGFASQVLWSPTGRRVPFSDVDESRDISCAFAKRNPSLNDHSDNLESSSIILQSWTHRTSSSNFTQIAFKRLSVLFHDSDFKVAFFIFFHVALRFWKVWRGFEVQHGNEDTSSP